MSPVIEPDLHGRQVEVDTVDGVDTYTITDGGTLHMELSFPVGTPQEKVYAAINAMCPPPPPVVDDGSIDSVIDRIPEQSTVIVLEDLQKRVVALEQAVAELRGA